MEGCKQLAQYFHSFPALLVALTNDGFVRSNHTSCAVPPFCNVLRAAPQPAATYHSMLDAARRPRSWVAELEWQRTPPHLLSRSCQKTARMILVNQEGKIEVEFFVASLGCKLTMDQVDRWQLLQNDCRHAPLVSQLVQPLFQGMEPAVY